jgi:predicted unusual protein kinase regulating ubiquinone biosynthesis (AarF/ABC1/UbiB family)
MKKMNTNFLARAPKILKTALKLTTKKDLEQVVEELASLKGMPQKLGQIISMDFSDYLPDEVKEKFVKLQSQSKAFDHLEILSIIKSGLSDDKFESICDFSTSPIGAGSIGQVHKAKINEQDVVFKVRYPEIEKTIKADLALMIPMAFSYEIFRPHSKDLSILMKEAKIMLLQEMNYKDEINFIKNFKAAFKNDSRFYLPEVIDEFCHENFICMEYIDGISLQQFIDSQSNPSEKRQVAESLIDLFIHEFFVLGMVQTDPNFANYIIKKNGQIALLDFGATKKFEKSFRDIYFELLKASFDENEHDIIFYGSKLGLVDRKDNKEAVDLFVSFMIDVMSYFKKENNPMDFSNEEITTRLFTKGFLLWQKQRISAPHSNLVFLHRKLGGLFSLLKKSQVKIDLSPMWGKIEMLNKRSN